MGIAAEAILQPYLRRAYYHSGRLAQSVGLPSNHFGQIRYPLHRRVAASPSNRLCGLDCLLQWSLRSLHLHGGCRLSPGATLDPSWQHLRMTAAKCNRGGSNNCNSSRGCSWRLFCKASLQSCRKKKMNNIFNPLFIYINIFYIFISSNELSPKSQFFIQTHYSKSSRSPLTSLRLLRKWPSDRTILIKSCADFSDLKKWPEFPGDLNDSENDHRLT